MLVWHYINVLSSQDCHWTLKEREMSPVQREQLKETLVKAALRVLNTAGLLEKARLGDSIASKWLQGITHPYDPFQGLPLPDRHTMLTIVKLVSPSLMAKLGTAGSLHSRQAIVHSLEHSESWAPLFFLVVLLVMMAALIVLKH